MIPETILRTVDNTIQREGGYVNNPHDRGGLPSSASQNAPLDATGIQVICETSHAHKLWISTSRST